MLTLLATTLTTSFFDSLNPSAIAQQMVLQAMVKKKRHIWFFILGISLANILMGLAIYYGIAAWVSRLLEQGSTQYPIPFYGAETAAGVMIGGIGLWLLRKTIRQKTTADTAQTPKTPASLSPVSLFVLGAAFCMVELTSAMPYFGFLAILAEHQLAAPLVVAFVCLYTFVYAFPLILLYFVSNKVQGTGLIQRLERVLQKISRYIVPAAVCILGLFCLVHGAKNLLIPL